MEKKQKVRKFIESNLIVFEDDIQFSDSDNIFQMGLVNSLFAMKLLNYVESEFDVSIADEDIDIKNFSSIENILQLINGKNILATDS